MLRDVADGLWVVDHPFKMGPVDVGTRTSIIRLEAGGLVLHAPGPLSDALRGELEALGPVRALIAPNKFHHLFVGENLRAFPQARLYLAPGLAHKRKDLAGGETLGEEVPALWAGELDQVWVRGAPMLEEVAFFHRASRSLILTDLAFNVRHASSLVTRLFLKSMGAYGRFGPSRLARFAMRDREAARAALDRILAWDFERVILAHGEILEDAGREALRESYAFL
jgi:hypothetical protein